MTAGRHRTTMVPANLVAGVAAEAETLTLAEVFESLDPGIMCRMLRLNGRTR